MRWIAALPMLALFGANPAVAQDRPAKPFEGTSLTAIVGVDGAHSYGDWGAGAVYGAQIGQDWQTNNLVLGIEGEVTGSSERRCNTVFFGPGDRRELCASMGRDIYAGGRIGKPIGEATLLYGKAGYTNVEQTFSSNRTVRGTSSGFRLGAGVEHRLTGGMSLKAEYRYSKYDNFDRHQAVLGLGFRF